jgi:predicted phosphodiesterase
MKTFIISDVHLEFDPFDTTYDDADLAILAGDIGIGLKGLEWAAKVFYEVPVIYVPGNHEYYGGAMPRLTDKLKLRGEELGVHVLDGDSLVLNGCTFFGATLWTDFALLGDPAIGEISAQQYMTDYKRIRISPGYRKLRPRDTSNMHFRARRWLENEIEAGRTEGAVIITHHAPSIRSLKPGRENEAVSAAYSSHLDDTVERSNAQLWIHGHTHYSMDYELGNTRVLSNQRGYPDEEDVGFEPGFYIDI